MQEAWLRLERTGAESIDDLDAWLTTVVGRLALDTLRSARSRREAYVGPWLPEPVVSSGGPGRPRHPRRVGQLRAARPARAALARRAHGVRAARRVRAAVRRGRGRRRPHARSGAPARLARPPPRRAAAPALRGLARRARAGGARVRASGRPRATSTASSPSSTRTSCGPPTAAGTRSPRASRCTAPARVARAGSPCAAGRRRRAAPIGLNGRLGLLLPGTDGHRSAALLRGRRRPHRPHRCRPQPGEAAARYQGAGA